MVKHHPTQTEFPKSFTQRIEAFTDGVFAIVITLLVLELRIPEIHGHGPQLGQELLAALKELLPKFVSFVVSFFYVSIYWYNHHQLFHPIKFLNRRLFWFNSLFLLFLTFIPFPTALIGSYPDSTVAVTVYGLAMMATAMSFVGMKIYIKNSSRLGAKAVIDKNDGFYLLAGPGLYLVAVVLGLIHVKIAIAIYLLVPVVYLFAGGRKTQTEGLN